MRPAVPRRPANPAPPGRRPERGRGLALPRTLSCEPGPGGFRLERIDSVDDVHTERRGSIRRPRRSPRRPVLPVSEPEDGVLTSSIRMRPSASSHGTPVRQVPQPPSISAPFRSPRRREMLEAVERVVVDERPHRIERRDGLAGHRDRGQHALSLDVGDGSAAERVVGHSRSSRRAANMPDRLIMGLLRRRTTCRRLPRAGKIPDIR